MIVQDIGTAKSLLHFNNEHRISDTLCSRRFVFPLSNLYDYAIIEEVLCKRENEHCGWRVVDKYEIDLICKKCLLILTNYPKI